MPFLKNLKIEAAVPWGPHVALSFEVDRRPGKVFHQALVGPAELPYAKDDKGKAIPWSINEAEWEAKLSSKKEKADKAIDATKDDDSGTWQHAASIGATDLVRNLSSRRPSGASAASL